MLSICYVAICLRIITPCNATMYISPAFRWIYIFYNENARAGGNRFHQGTYSNYAF